MICISNLKKSDTIIFLEYFIKKINMRFVVILQVQNEFEDKLNLIILCNF